MFIFKGRSLINPPESNICGTTFSHIYKAYCFHEDLVANKSDVKIYDQRKDIDTLLTHEKI